MRIVRAKLEETAVVSSILQDAAQRLVDRGEALWTPEQFDAERLEPIIQADEVILAYLENHAVGTAFLEREDPTFWPDVPAGESLFIHKLAVRSTMTGQGVATAIMDWAKLEVARVGRRFLRLDCADRPKLRAVYEGMGFRLRDIRHVGAFTACRYEFDVTR